MTEETGVRAVIRSISGADVTSDDLKMMAIFDAFSSAIADLVEEGTDMEVVHNAFLNILIHMIVEDENERGRTLMPKITSMVNRYLSDAEFRASVEKAHYGDGRSH